MWGFMQNEHTNKNSTAKPYLDIGGMFLQLQVPL